MGCFIGGLKEIAVDVKMFRPQFVCAAVGLARMQEEKLQRVKRTSIRPIPSRMPLSQPNTSSAPVGHANVPT